jgi:RHH-type rel operon transcriptional repressor/antitoxin RelB
MSTTMTIRLEPAMKERLEQLAEATHRSKSYLAAEAIAEYVSLHEWQIREIHTAVTEADAGDFASQAEVDAFAKKWGVHAG